MTSSTPIILNATTKDLDNSFLSLLDSLKAFSRAGLLG